MRAVPASLFANAPRLHTSGIASDEIPTILQRGEGVFTVGQMEALGFQHSALASLASALSAASAERLAPPADLAGSSTPAHPSASAAATARPEPATLQTATTSQPRFDGEKMILDIVTRHVTQPGALRGAVRTA